MTPDEIAGLAEFYDNLTPEQEAELDRNSEDVELRYRPPRLRRSVPIP